MAALLVQAEAGATPGRGEIADALAEWPPLLEVTARHALNLALPEWRVRLLALGDLVGAWKLENPPRGYDPNVCAACREPIGTTRSGIAIGDGDAWLHFGGHLRERCWVRWSEQRTAAALRALLGRALGESS